MPRVNVPAGVRLIDANGFATDAFLAWMRGESREVTNVNSGVAQANARALAAQTGVAQAQLTATTAQNGVEAVAANVQAVQAETVAFYITPDKISIGAGDFDPGTLETESVTITITGGTAPYTIAWDTAGDIDPTSPTAATTTFSAFVPSGTTLSEQKTCTVTDATSATATTTIAVTLSVSSGGRFGDPLVP